MQKGTQSGNVLRLAKSGIFPTKECTIPRKPGKIRVVFDCSSEYQGAVLNKALLQGSDQMKSLIGVLLRFRKERIPIVCDIEGMFHQVLVSPEHRDF